MFQLLVDKSDCATDILPPEEIQAEQVLAAGGIFPIGSNAKKKQDLFFIHACFETVRFSCQQYKISRLLSVLIHKA